MRQAISKQARAARGWVALAIALVVGAVSVIAAAPARANNEFQNAFEDHLGRLAAYQAVAFGVGVLSGAYYPVVAPIPYYAPPVVYAPSYGPGYGSYYGRPHGVKVRQAVYYQEQPCNRGYDRGARYYEDGGHARRGHGHGQGHGRGED